MAKELQPVRSNLAGKNGRKTEAKMKANPVLPHKLASNSHIMF